MPRDRWEHGSEFHWVDPPTGGGDGSVENSLAGPGVFFGTGRQALVGAVTAVSGGRFFVPDFFCPDVTADLVRRGVDVVGYPDRPVDRLELPPARPGDAVLVVNHFGLRDLRGSATSLRESGVLAIEDHTHDPGSAWARESAADYCFASLRKTLPLPDGGMLWSPARRKLPACPHLTDAHVAATHAKLSAMLLKRHYLAGGAIDKSSFRELAVSAEQALTSEKAPSRMAPLGHRLLSSGDWGHWRRRRAENYRLFQRRVSGDVELLDGDGGGAPVACVLLAPTAPERERWVRELIQLSIYPAVLWRLDHSPVPVSAGSAALAARVLAIHCDGRYAAADMLRVADAVVRVARSK